MKSLISILLAVLIVYSSSAGAADLAGVELGSQATVVGLEKLGIVVLGDGSQVRPGKTYRGKMRFDYVDAVTVVDVDQAGIISGLRAEFQTPYFESMRDLALKKWGKPVDGGTFALQGYIEKIAIWTAKDGSQITLESFDPSIEHGTLTKGSLVILSKEAAAAKRGSQGSSL